MQAPVVQWQDVSLPHKGKSLINPKWRTETTRVRIPAGAFIIFINTIFSVSLMKNILNLFLAFFLACNLGYGLQLRNESGRTLIIPKKQEQKAEQEKKTIKYVGVPDLAILSKGSLETKGLRGCHCVIGLYKKGNEHFGFMSHYWPISSSEHLDAIRKIKNLYNLMQNYDNTVIVAFRLDEYCITDKNDGEYRRNYVKNFSGFVEELEKLFPEAKIVCEKYEMGEKGNGETIKFNIDNGCYIKTTAKDTTDLLNLLK